MARRTYGLAKAIGKRIEQARLDAGMTQPELAAAAHISLATVDNLTHGRHRNPGVGTLADVAKALRVDPVWLCFGVGREKA